MKKYLLVFFTFMVFQACSQNESIFELSPAQSMSITGKGQGQDAAYNPYSNGKSISVVENIGKSNFVIRIQKAGKIIEQIAIKPTETKEVDLQKGYELYLDSESKGKAKVTFKKAEL